MEVTMPQKSLPCSASTLISALSPQQTFAISFSLRFTCTSIEPISAMQSIMVPAI